MRRVFSCCAVIAASVLAVAPLTVIAQSRAAGASSSVRLYVLDGGVLASDPTRYHLSLDDVAETSLSVAAYLIVHPRGVLLWDAGAIADWERISPEAGVEQHVVRQDGDDRFVVLAPPLEDQITDAGFALSDVTHLVLSHYHWDHTANASLFPDALWLVTAIEREKMFGANPPGGTRPVTYTALENNRVEIIDEIEHDVFGDGTVVIRQTPGHTEGHLVLLVELENTGSVVLSGDLYHYSAERTLNRLPDFDVSEAQTAKSRAELEEVLTKTGADLWIQHDLVHHRTLKLAPAYYD